VDQVRQLLRYVLPGFVWVTLTGIGLLIVIPDQTQEWINRLAAKEGLGAALTSLLAIGTFGYIFATFHHWLHWNCRKYSGGIFDVRGFVNQMMVKGLVKSEVSVNREQAEAICYSLWYQRMDQNCSIGGASDRKVCSLGDQTHGFGAACVAATFAALTTVPVCAEFGNLSIHVDSIPRNDSDRCSRGGLLSSGLSKSRSRCTWYV
jgi:hypothetical protein